jgi:hypothetical protein
MDLTRVESKPGFKSHKTGSRGGLLAFFFIWRRDLVVNVIPDL